MKDYYLLLEVHPNARKEVIQSAYRTLAKIYHPDSKIGNSEIMQMLNEAYEILTNDEKRAGYDSNYSSKYVPANEYVVIDKELQEKERELKLKEKELARRERIVNDKEEAYKEKKEKAEKIEKIKKKIELEDKIKALGDAEVPENKKYVYLKDIIRDGKKNVKILLTHYEKGNEDMRFFIIQALVELEADNPIFFINALFDESPKVKAEAAHAIGNLKITNAGESISYLLEDEDELVRKEAVYAIGEIGYSKINSRLVDIATNKKENTELRLACLRALARNGLPEDIDNLQKIFKDKNELIKKEADKTVFMINQKDYFIKRGV